ncbi:LCP family protein [uncultured Tyzzerella sp.]|uniref:LCP family protein n=1 Tax=uncultured Tyzzerella sp. TaxID=2321398 RepID=UPI002941E8D0|nr:LCP family protein [uncultured Tyzzerella sp.]
MRNLDIVYRKRFFSTFFSVFSVLLICLLFVFFGYKFLKAEPAYDPSKQRDSSLITEKEIKQQTEQKSNGIFTPPVRTNVLVAGVDEAENLTDVLMVASFISTTGQINLISIPRDTYISYSGKDLENMRSINRHIPSHMKANSIYAYTKSSGMEGVKTTIESMLGIKIDYYVKVNLNAFRSIVDAVGGIYFDVPKGGLKYSDPTQDLYINLKEGSQLLDGKAAEGLVRFRKGYARQDLQRVEVQQQFIQQFITQVLNKETLMKNLGEISLNVIKYVETDFSISDFPKYLNSIPNIKPEKMKTSTLPGTTQMIDNLSYYLLDNNGVKSIVDEFFYGNTDPDKEITTQTISEKTE